MVRRYQRRKELQLLAMSPAEMKTKVPSFGWQQMMTSGLEREEVRALAHCLRQPGVPAQVRYSGYIGYMRRPNPLPSRPSPPSLGRPRRS